METSATDNVLIRSFGKAGARDSQTIEEFHEVMRAKVPIEFMAAIEERTEELHRARSLLKCIAGSLVCHADSGSREHAHHAAASWRLR